MSMPPTKPTLPVFDAMAGEDADEVGALLLLEDDRAHVGQVDDRVDDGEMGVGEFLGDLVDARRPGEADAR